MEGKIVVIPIWDGVLVLTHDQYQAARERGREFSQHNGKPAQEPEKIVDADEAAKLTNKVPASWFLEAARQGKIPYLRFGKYVRFRMSDVTKALEVRQR